MWLQKLAKPSQEDTRSMVSTLFIPKEYIFAYNVIDFNS